VVSDLRENIAIFLSHTGWKQASNPPGIDGHAHGSYWALWWIV